MKKFSADEYREIAQDAIAGTGAFLRLSRTDELFVTDLPRRLPGFSKVCEVLGDTFEIRTENDLMFLSPALSGFETEFRKLLVCILKAEGEKREKLVRNALAVALRLKRPEEAEILNKILEEDMQYEA